MTDKASARREQVLGRVRENLTKRGSEGVAPRATTAEERIGHPVRHLEPARVRKDAAGLRGMFRAYLEGQSARVVEVANGADVPQAVAGYLREKNLPAGVRVGADAYLEALPWEKTPGLERKSGRAAPDDMVSLSRASVAVAETGTLVMTSGSDNPVTLNYMPDTHIVVVRASDIVGPYETAWDRVRAAFGKGRMPRTVNFISGPSRTGDIGGRLVMGAHGPRQMCVIVVGDE